MNVTRLREPPARQCPVSVRGTRLLVRFLVLVLAGAALSLPDSVRAQPAPGPAPAADTAPRTYTITGEASVDYEFTSDRGQQAVAGCDIPFLKHWEFEFKGTLDTFTNQVSGTISTPGKYFDLDNPRSDTIQCGQYTDDAGTVYNCCSKEVGYYYYYWTVQDAPNTFSGYYDDSGRFQAFGTVGLVFAEQSRWCTAYEGRWHNVDCGTVLRGGASRGLPQVGGGWVSQPLAPMKLEFSGTIHWDSPVSGSGAPNPTINAWVTLPTSNFYPWGFKQPSENDTNSILSGTPAQ